MKLSPVKEIRSPGLFWVSLAALCLLGPGCGSSRAAHEDGEIQTPDSPIFQEGCVGLTPPESAWPAITYPETDLQSDNDLQSDIGDVAQTSDTSVSDLSDLSGLDSPTSEVIDQDMPRAPEDVGHDVTTDLSDLGGTEIADTSDGIGADVSECQDKPATCLDAPAPAYSLLDFQPKSCGFGAIYGLDLYEKEVTVVVLLAAW